MNRRLAILHLATALLTLLALFGCANDREFPLDGNFTAYSLSVSSNAPQVTMVTVTIENDEIVGYELDVRQGQRTSTVDDQGTVELEDDVTTYQFAWKEQTKLELGFEYKMHYRTYMASLLEAELATMEGYLNWLSENNQLEWHQQAELIEVFWLNEGVTNVQIDEEGNHLNVAGVSVSDQGYTDLAKEAIELAKAGKFQAFVCSGTDFYFAEMTMNGTEIVSLSIDVWQANASATEGSFSWKEMSKRQLGYHYKMHYNSYVASLDNVETATLEGYQGWLFENNRLEWFEQVDLVTAYVIANGWDENLQSISGRGVSLDGVTALDGTSGVTVKTDTYNELLGLLFGQVDEE
ncbi:MAG: hypothetical protein AB7S88_03480 [Candidatus Izemoplasmatales bacterium]